MPSPVQFRLRILHDDLIAIGPGKVALLEAVAETGSISAAARQFGMSYRRAWLLIDEMNKALVEPVVATATGGAHGGGARLTDTGRKVITHYRAVESTARIAAADDLAALTRLLARRPTSPDAPD
ncbi:MAG: Molybdenum-pterin-binding protein MopA [Paracidovorax wautersii]|uniref:Molybdenum-pterin-binding protein MopA n=1 Tax=Paracidovorax wautersii TaxID=1177982 RepID=A0A7V8FS32_9BURK|nr:MAG: Molybdenum-pterin-binding protein MopA [Paracidovorax wautersii]